MNKNKKRTLRAVALALPSLLSTTQSWGYIWATESAYIDPDNPTGWYANADTAYGGDNTYGYTIVRYDRSGHAQVLYRDGYGTLRCCGDQHYASGATASLDYYVLQAWWAVGSYSFGQAYMYGDLEGYGFASVTSSNS